MTRSQVTIDGNEAAAYVAHKTNEVIAIYPITPSSSMGEHADAWSARGEPNIWGKRADWVRLEGTKDGKTIGIAIFNHPASACYPTYWHARGYGLFSANPLGQLDFQTGTKVENPQPLNFTLNPGQNAIFRFLMIIYEGRKTPDELEQIFTKSK